MKNKLEKDAHLGVASRVIDAYDSARRSGAARSEAFCRAVTLYRSEKPGLPVELAGAEVARLLLAAARAQLSANAVPTDMQETTEMKYANSV
jgi:hypothetical protein